jgi:hypothetical protein
MTDQHPITPPPELVQQWEEQWCDMPVIRPSINSYMAIQSAQWGADQELEACCEWTRDSDGYDAALALRADRRPKPLSLKERALRAWAAVEAGTDDQTAMAVIRRALESLPD